MKSDLAWIVRKAGATAVYNTFNGESTVATFGVYSADEGIENIIILIAHTLLKKKSSH